MRKLTKDELNRRIEIYVSAFRAFEETLRPGKLLAILDNLAWRRLDADIDQRVQARAIAYGFLHGQERMLVHVCNALGERSVARRWLDILLDAKMKGGWS